MQTSFMDGPFPRVVLALSWFISLRYIANWKESMRNLSAAGIETICYDFMPVVNWTRTDLDHK